MDAHLGSHDDIIWRFPPVPHKEKVLNDAIGQAFQFIFTTGVLRTFAYTRVYARIRVYTRIRRTPYRVLRYAYFRVLVFEGRTDFKGVYTHTPRAYCVYARIRTHTPRAWRIRRTLVRG